MLELMWWTGMRPGEARMIRGADIDANWVYRPASHKCAWRGLARVIPLGPRAVSILKPWLRDGLCFTTLRGGPWTIDALCHSVAEGCERAGVKLTSYQLRHAFKRRAIAAGGVAAAMAALGQRSSEAFDRYDAGGDFGQAAELARRIG